MTNLHSTSDRKNAVWSLETGLTHLERAIASKDDCEIAENLAVAAYLVAAAFRLLPTVANRVTAGPKTRAPDEDFVADLVTIVGDRIDETLIRTAFSALEQLLSEPDDGFHIDRQAFVGLMGAELLAFHFRQFMEARRQQLLAGLSRRETADYPTTTIQ
jgi:hypothetical protein